MSLESADDLLGWLDVLVLDPDDPTSSTPVGRLADWERHADAHEWSEADRLAMREFVRFKALPSMARVMDTVRKGQAALLKSDSVAGALARAWPGGVHPLQSAPESGPPAPGAWSPSSPSSVSTHRASPPASSSSR
jgi:hypothetical protein